jgi:hypothetical protein|tara:strand:- start:14635 stop:16773 length:2139 start_codon:yes stop_codon:yes gene_type:complete
MPSVPSSDEPEAVDKEHLPGPAPVVPDPRIDVVAFRETKEGQDLVSWGDGEFTRCKTAKLPKQRQWYTNLAMVFGQQWLTVATGAGSAAGKLQVAQAPKHVRRKTINRLRSFVRTETSKFLSTLPNVVSVPSTAEDEDVRAAYAAEQVWMSYSEVKKFRRQYSAGVWWAVLTGTGFVKTCWNPEVEVKMPEGVDYGDIEYLKVTPFHIFVPELREREIDDQPYVIEARVRTVEWVKSFYGDKLNGMDLSPSTNAANTILDEAYLNLQNSENNLDSVVVKEFWVKPGTTKHLPKGGFFVMVEDILVDYYEGLPYTHGEYPYTKMEHLFNDTFWADSPLVDLIPLQKEYNEIRTDINVAGRRMAMPQLLAAQNSIVPGKMTNEPGSVILYRPGLPQPTPMPLSQLPSYFTDQQDRIIMDFEDLSGQHEVSRGQAPSGVTAGTALAYLGERDDNFLTPQYQGIEDAVERIARQTLLLFQQYVDMKRKIKVVGLDGAFDTMLLSGSDIQNGTDIRVEPGTAVGQSQAAKQAQVMDLVGLGIIGPDQALKMLEIGGPQKILDIVNAAERKAQRENMKMKSFREHPEIIEQHNSDVLQQAVQQLPPGMSPEQILPILQQFQQNLPPVVDVDDFDVHEVHIETHNRFRMSQEYETLPDEVKEQFEKHVAYHQQMGAVAMQNSLMSQMPPEIAAEGQEEQGIQPPSGTMAPTEDPGAPPA